MCGIAGIVDYRLPPDRSLVDSMLAELTHRGPDAEGIELCDEVAFGHRRLSIIDISGGGQPMWSGDRTLLLTFNGEIFNYLELRQELLERGCQFSSNSDTEVILEAYRAWGTASFERLNGQFAFALFDRNERALFLVRDRLGEKPLYYFKSGPRFAFASELKSLILAKRRSGERVDLACDALSDYMSLNYVPFERTLVSGILSITPGTFMKIDSKGPAMTRYWQPSVTQFRGTLDEACDELRLLLAESVRIRLRSDVPVALFLSGGTDSTLIADCLRKQSAKTSAFVANFHDSNFSERKIAELVSQNLQLPLNVVDIDPDKENLPNLIERLVYHGDEPLADSSALPVYLLSRQVGQNFKVALSGEGGDELFGGYLTYRATRLTTLLGPLGRRLLFLFRNATKILPISNVKVGYREMAERFLKNLDLPPGAAHFAWNGMLRAHEKARLLDPDICHDSSEPETFKMLATRLVVDLRRPKLQELLLADQKNYLCSDILAKTDRMSMAHGLELRPAFLDHRIVEFSRALPPEFLANVWHTKVLIKRLLATDCPWYPVNARKQGFSIPVHEWFRSKIHSFADEVFRSDFASQCGVFKHRALVAYWERHLARQINVGFELWGMMILILWMKRFGVSR